MALCSSLPLDSLFLNLMLCGLRDLSTVSNVTIASRSMADEIAKQPEMQDPAPDPSSTHKSLHEDNVSLDKFEELTTVTQDNPYHPEPWLKRAEFFVQKEYYELACADAYKAHMLCDEYLRLMLPANAKAPAMNTLVLNDLRDRAACFIYITLRELGATTAATTYRSRFPTDLLLPTSLPHGIDPDNWSEENKPKLKRNQYPWLSQRTQPRDIQQCQDDLAEDGLRIDQASFTDDHTIYGLFTSESIPAEDVIVVDNVTKLKIKKKLKTDEHPSMLLLQRMLFIAVNEANNEWANGFDILSVKPTNTLTVTYDVPRDHFSFTRLIQQVAAFLFKKDRLFCPEFDFWRIFTLYWRLCTNCFEHLPPDPEDRKKVKTMAGIAPLYSFCNHSCEPNSRWELIHREGGSKGAVLMQITAEKNIEANEEIFIYYIKPNELAKPVTERRALLMDWLGTNCRCTKCTRDEGQSRKISASSSTKARPTGTKFAGSSNKSSVKRKRDDVLAAGTSNL